MILLYRARPRAPAAFAALMFFAGGARAQAGVALGGSVVDESGGPLPTATVTVHKLSGERLDQSSQTDSRGHYSFPELPDGEYSIEAALNGFVSMSYKPVRIYFPAQVQWDFVLRLGGFSYDAVYSSSEVVGELLWRGARAPAASICLSRTGGPYHPVCTVTNRLGQYFLRVPPAVYTVTIENKVGLRAEQRLDLSTAGEYRNKIALPGGR